MKELQGIAVPALCVYIGELAWTKACKDVPAFNFINIEHVMIAASEGGNAFARDTKKMAAEGSVHAVAVALLEHPDSHTVSLTVASPTREVAHLIRSEVTWTVI